MDRISGGIMANLIDSYPRETVEFIRFASVTSNGVPTVDFKYALALEGDRPSTWNDPTDLGGGVRGFLLTASDLEPGLWQVWVKVNSTSEHPVILAGRFLIE
jgi:hypothetical protein